MDIDDEPLGMTRRSRLSADITFLMLKGAGYALVGLLVIWLVIVVIAGIGRALPDESRDATDPSPWSEYSSLETAPSITVVG